MPGSASASEVRIVATSRKRLCLLNATSLPGAKTAILATEALAVNSQVRLCRSSPTNYADARASRVRAAFLAAADR
jgi:hypothetical protein